MNTVQYLLDNPFTTLSYNNKIAVKTSKRPTPELNLVNKQMAKGKDLFRKFKSEMYQKNDWLCGCDVRNALFCFPCLLFGGDPAWSQKGITNLIHLGQLIRRHEMCEKHLKNVLSFTFLSNMDMSPTLSSDYKKTIQQHNEEVTKNRQALNLIINSIRFCAPLESSLRDPEEKEKSQLHQDLIDFGSELDFTIKGHMDKTPVFKETKILQNELLDIMLQVYHDNVFNELKNTDHVSIIIDDTTDISSQAHLVLVFRYVVDGNPVERFWKFLNPVDRSVDGIFQSILSEITSVISISEKLISHSYCGANLNEVSAKIKNEYPSSNLIHCYAHQPNRIMYNAASNKSQCRAFFANLTGLCHFFSISPKLSQMLNDILKKHSSPKMKNNVNFRFINVIYEYRNELIKILETITTDRETTVHSTIQQSGAYARVLKDNSFAYWLSIFQKLFAPLESLFDQIQKRVTDTTKTLNGVETFEMAVENVRRAIRDSAVKKEVSRVDENTEGSVEEIANNIKIEIIDDVIKDEVYDKVGVEDEETDHIFQDELYSNRLDIEEPRPLKRRRLECDDKSAAIQVCNLLLADIKNIFKCSGHLASSKLFITDLFPSFDKTFPNEFFNQTVTCFPFLDQNRLKIELKALYNSEVLRNTHGTASLLSILLGNGLSNIFQETTKLLKVVLTIPMITSDSELCFPKLSNIKNFLRNASSGVTEDKLNALGVLCCEIQFLNEIDNFNNKVMDILANKNHRKKDFAYCQINTGS